MKWEYEVIEAPAAGVPATQMNSEFGEKGWQLCGIIPKEKDGTAYYFYFVRQGAEDEEAVDTKESSE